MKWKNTTGLYRHNKENRAGTRKRGRAWVCPRPDEARPVPDTYKPPTDDELIRRAADLLLKDTRTML